MAQNANGVKTSKNAEVAQKVVDRLIDMVNAGQPLPWVKPWGRDLNTITVVDGMKTITQQSPAWNRDGKLYSGCNAWLLPRGEYITYNQCKAEGGKIRKGAKAFPVVYWNFFKVKDTDKDGNEIEKEIPFLKYYNVFQISDCEGLEQKHDPGPIVTTIAVTHEEPVDGNADLNSTAETVIADYLAKYPTFRMIRDQKSDKAFYSPAKDYVQVPMREQFKEISEYYSTTFHELGHSTGHSTRLNRFTGAAANAHFGSESYSREELVAEMTAATICNMVGLERANQFRNSAAYIQSWASHIKNDPLMFVTAATRAAAAVDCILCVK